MKKYIRNICLLSLGALLLAGNLQSTRADSGSTENIKITQTPQPLPNLMIGCDEYEPYNYMDENGNLVGIDADLAEEAFHRMGYEPVYVIMKWTEKDDYLENGVIDCIWDSYSMNGKEDSYLWSDPYMYSREAVIVNKDSSIYKLEDLNGSSMATLVNTRTEDILLDTELFPEISPQNVYSFQKMEECLAALRQDYIDAAAGDIVYLRTCMKNYPGKFRIISESMETSRFAVAFAKDEDPSLVEDLNNVLKEMKQDGTIDEILSRYEVSDGDFLGEDTDSE